MLSTLEPWLDRQIPVQSTTTCAQVATRFQADPTCGIFPVQDEGGVIITLLIRDHFLGSFAGPFAWSLLSGRTLAQWLSLRGGNLAPQTIAITATPDEAARLLSESGSSTTTLVVLDRDGVYAGLVHERSLLTGMLNELAKARDRALAASEAKTMFLATMSHELRTPLNGIIGLSDLLLLEQLSPTQRELSGLVRSSGQHLLELVSQILDFSGLEAGQIQLRTRPFTLTSSLHEVVAVIGAYAQRKGVHLSLAVEPTVPLRVVGDQLRLRQVLANLIGNAVKFTAQGEVEVVVDRDPDGRIRFSIADTGKGIDESTMRRLFQPFVQADSSLTRTHDGSGMGLAISQRLVQLMGGTIQVMKRDGCGSLFQFSLPMLAA